MTTKNTCVIKSFETCKSPKIRFMEDAGIDLATSRMQSARSTT